MKVTIIGAGNMGRGIGTRVVAGGNELELVDRDPADARTLAEELNAAAGAGGSATALEPGRTIGGEVVVLAVYYPSTRDAVEEYKEQLRGRVVVDVSNPFDFETFEPVTESSGAEEIAALVPEGTQVVKAFNTTFARTLAPGEVAGQPLDVFIAGDSADAKGKVSRLIEGGGLRSIDAGPLKRARQLEQLGLLHIGLQDALGTGFGSAVKIVP
jgi:NADPH-dependent F420 reductase